MASAYIDIQDASIVSSRGYVLSPFSLCIERGEFIIVAGPNGAGKTTFLTAINGLRRLTHGEVYVDGVKLISGNASRIRRRIGYVPQISPVDPRMPMCVRDVIMLGRAGRAGILHKLSRRDGLIVDAVADFTGVGTLKNFPVGQLSGGEQKKVSIARALAQEPHILLLDEPVSHLDLKAQADIVELLDTIHESRRITIIMVMHDLNIIPRRCQRMVLMKTGNVVFDGSPREALRESVLSFLYDCSVQVKRDANGVTIRVRRGN